MWGCMTWEGVGMACKIDGRMDTDLYLQIMEDELQIILSSSRTIIPNTLAKGPRSGLLSIDLRSWCGQLSLQTLIP